MCSNGSRNSSFDSPFIWPRSYRHFVFDLYGCPPPLTSIIKGSHSSIPVCLSVAHHLPLFYNLCCAPTFDHLFINLKC